MKEHDHSQSKNNSSSQSDSSNQSIADPAISSPLSGQQGNMLQLQRAMGNRAVMQMLRDSNGQYGKSGIIKPAMQLKAITSSSSVIQKMNDHDAQEKLNKKKTHEWQAYLQSKLDKAKNHQDAMRYLRYFSNYTNPEIGWQAFYRIPWEAALKKNGKIGVYPPDQESKAVVDPSMPAGVSAAAAAGDAPVQDGPARAPLIDEQISRATMALNEGSTSLTMARAIKSSGSAATGALALPDKITEAIEKGGASAATHVYDKASIAMASRYGQFTDELEDFDDGGDPADSEYKDVSLLLGNDSSAGSLAKTGAIATGKFLAKKAAGIPVNLIKGLVGIPLAIAEGITTTFEGIGKISEVRAMTTQINIFYSKLAAIHSSDKLFDPELRDRYIQTLDLLLIGQVFSSAKKATSSGLAMGQVGASSEYSGATGSEIHDDFSSAEKDSTFSGEAKKNQSLKGVAATVQSAKGLVGKSSSQKDYIVNTLIMGLQAPLDTDKTIAQLIIENILGLPINATDQEIRERL
jgi:hypothetical protein